MSNTSNGDAVSANGTANRANGSTPSLPQQPEPAPSPIIRKKLNGYVGFANLPNQVHRKSVRKGFQFTAMVVGTHRCHAVSRVPLSSLPVFAHRRVGFGQIHAH